MATSAEATFSCLFEHDVAVRLSGAAGKQPITPGQMIIAHGMHEDGTETGAGIFLVLRLVSPSQYVLAPMGSADEYWDSYLTQLPTVKARLQRSSSERVPTGMELLGRWRIMSEEGEVPRKKDYGGFGKPLLENLSKKWHSLKDLVVKEPAQVGNDISGNP